MGIPISEIVKVTPGVLATGGGLDTLTGLILSSNTTAVPAGTVKQFTSLSAVETAFGSSSVEAGMATVYFSGYTTATQTPYRLLFGGVAATSGTISTDLDTALSANGSWNCVTTAYELDLADKKLFAQWIGNQNCSYYGTLFDTDTEATTDSSTTAFGAWLAAQSINGVTVVYKDPNAAALCLGWAASLPFATALGRRSLFGIQNDNVTPSVTDGATANILTANGYNFYSDYAQGGTDFNFFVSGTVSGKFLWADSYVNQIWLNSNLTTDLVNLLLDSGQIPYNTRGDSLVSTAVQSTIDQALSFGAIQTGITLTTSQKQQINNATGNTSAADAVVNYGYYLKPNVSSSTPEQRVARTGATALLYYSDGQSLQSISLNSYEVQ